MTTDGGQTTVFDVERKTHGTLVSDGVDNYGCTVTGESVACL